MEISGPNNGRRQDRNDIDELNDRACDDPQMITLHDRLPDSNQTDRQIFIPDPGDKELQRGYYK